MKRIARFWPVFTASLLLGASAAVARGSAPTGYMTTAYVRREQPLDLQSCRAESQASIDAWQAGRGIVACGARRHSSTTLRSGFWSYFGSLFSTGINARGTLVFGVSGWVRIAGGRFDLGIAAFAHGPVITSGHCGARQVYRLLEARHPRTWVVEAEIAGDRSQQ